MLIVKIFNILNFLKLYIHYLDKNLERWIIDEIDSALCLFSKKNLTSKDPASMRKPKTSLLKEIDQKPGVCPKISTVISSLVVLRKCKNECLFDKNCGGENKCVSPNFGLNFI